MWYSDKKQIELEASEAPSQGMNFFPLLIPLAAAAIPMISQMLGGAKKDDGVLHGQAAIDAKQAKQVAAAQAQAQAEAKAKSTKMMWIVGGIGASVVLLGGLGLLAVVLKKKD